jgi:hypothetical protein
MTASHGTCAFCGDSGRLEPCNGYDGRLSACVRCLHEFRRNDDGANAFDAGVPIGDCPFPPGPDREAWLDGYLHAERFELSWLDDEIARSA